MFKSLFIFLSLLPSWVIGQTNVFETENKLNQFYIQAIEDFIGESNKKNNTSFDTLYFLNRKDGDPENDFPDIDLPNKIKNTQILLITPENGLKTQHENKLRKYVNMIGWINEKNAEFLFFVFSNGFEYKYNFKLNYTIDAELGVFKLINSKYYKAGDQK